MSRIQLLEKQVIQLYTKPTPAKNPHCTWLLPNHVLVVADIATKLAKKYNESEELSHASALLHDIADVEMERNNPQHEQRSLAIGRLLLEETNFTQDEIKIVIDDAAKFHSCYENAVPKSAVGKILATADAIAHFHADFYPFITNILAQSMTKNEIAAWVRDKIERDISKKIFFADEKNEVMPLYNALKQNYSI